MWPDWVSNPGPLTYESGVLPSALRGPTIYREAVVRIIGIKPNSHIKQILYTDRVKHVKHPKDGQSCLSKTTVLPRDNQRDREQQTLLKSIRSHRG